MAFRMFHGNCLSALSHTKTSQWIPAVVKWHFVFATRLQGRIGTVTATDRASLAPLSWAMYLAKNKSLTLGGTCERNIVLKKTSSKRILRTWIRTGGKSIWMARITLRVVFPAVRDLSRPVICGSTFRKYTRLVYACTESPLKRVW